jgi:fatty-acyl-CoA synthase
MAPKLPLPSLPRLVTAPASMAVDQALVLPLLVQAGILAPVRPDKVVRMADALRRYGATPAAACAASAARYGPATAIADERGELTYDELEARTSDLAAGLAGLGVHAGQTVAVMCRNHRGLLEAVIAAGKLGAHALLLNTGFAGPQLAEVADREGAGVVVFDEEFRDLVTPALEGRLGVVAWTEVDDGLGGDPTLEALIAAGDGRGLPAPPEHGRFVLLTSGTTGTPKGARRDTAPRGLGLAGALLSKIPMRTGEPTHVAAPAFHTLGFGHALLTLVLGGTLVLRRHFDPEAALAAVAEHRCRVLVLVPVMLKRILDLPDDVRARYDVSGLRVIHATGSAMGAALAQRALEEYGDVLYSLYGSTEVAWVTIATPQDLRAAPGCAGRPPRGTGVRLYDADGRRVPRGARRPSASYSRTPVPRGGRPAQPGAARRSCGVAIVTQATSVEP